MSTAYKYIYVYIYICISICIYKYLSMYLSIYLSFSLSLYIYIYYIYNIYMYIYIYPQTRVSPFPGLISAAWVNEQKTTDVTRVLKAPGAELCQNACGVVNEQKIFCSQQCSPKCSMNIFRAYISTDTCFVLPRTLWTIYIYTTTLKKS